DAIDAEVIEDPQWLDPGDVLGELVPAVAISELDGNEPGQAERGGRNHNRHPLGEARWHEGDEDGADHGQHPDRGQRHELALTIRSTATMTAPATKTRT